jgi:hypothetical protein
VLTLILIISFHEYRGLAAVHSYDSTLCHRDVKSFNFLGKLCRLLAHACVVIPVCLPVPSCLC